MGSATTPTPTTTCKLSAQTIAPGDDLTVSVEVSNLGRRDGDEVVQVYLSDTEASAPVPIRQLVGFKRVHLEAGETRRVSFTIPAKAFALVDAQGRRIIEPGAFIVAVGRRPAHRGRSTG